MYALLDKSQIKVGPRQYAVSFFKEYLDKNNVAFDLPFDFSDESIVISDDIKIVRVQDPTTPSYNSVTEQLAGPYYDTSVEPITGYYEVADRDLTAAKNDLKAKAAEERYRKECSGVKVTIQGTEVLIDTNRDARHIWFQSLMLLPAGVSQKFKFDREIWLNLTKDDISTVVTAIVAHVQDAFDWESAKIVEIDSAVDKVALEAVVIVEPAA